MASQSTTLGRLWFRKYSRKSLSVIYTFMNTLTYYHFMLAVNTSTPEHIEISINLSEQSKHSKHCILDNNLKENKVTTIMNIFPMKIVPQKNNFSETSYNYFFFTVTSLGKYNFETDYRKITLSMTGRKWRMIWNHKHRDKSDFCTDWPGQRHSIDHSFGIMAVISEQVPSTWYLYSPRRSVSLAKQTSFSTCLGLLRDFPE